MRISTVIACSKRIALYIIESSTYSKDSQNIQALLFEDMQKFGSTDEILIMHNAGGSPWLCIMRYYALPYGCLNKRDFSCLQFFDFCVNEVIITKCSYALKHCNIISNA